MYWLIYIIITTRHQRSYSTTYSRDKHYGIRKDFRVFQNKIKCTKPPAEETGRRVGWQVRVSVYNTHIVVWNIVIHDKTHLIIRNNITRSTGRGRRTAAVFTCSAGVRVPERRAAGRPLPLPLQTVPLQPPPPSSSSSSPPPPPLPLLPPPPTPPPRSPLPWPRVCVCAVRCSRPPRSLLTSDLCSTDCSSCRSVHAGRRRMTWPPRSCRRTARGNGRRRETHTVRGGVLRCAARPCRSRVVRVAPRRQRRETPRGRDTPPPAARHPPRRTHPRGTSAPRIDGVPRSSR